MAVPRALGADPLLSARIVNALAAFVTAAVLSLLFESAAGTIAAIAGVLVVLVTTSFVGVHLSVLSEPLFLASLVLTLWAMVSAQRPLVAGIPAALAAMVRYAGACAPTAIVLWFFFTGAKSMRARFTDAARAAVIPAIVIVLWLARSIRVGDNTGAPELGLNGGFGPTFREATQTFADWLAPMIQPPTLQVIVATALAIGVIIIGVNGMRHSSERARTILKADGLLFLSYAFVLMSARVLVGSAIPFDFRLLAPAILLAEVAIILSFAGYFAGAGKRARWIVATACVLWFVASLSQSASNASDAVTDGSDFASSDWRESPTLDWVRSRSAGWTLFSNWPSAIYFHTSRIARDVPQSPDSADMHDFAVILQKSHGAVVAFDSGNPDYPPGDSLAHALGLVKLGEFSDGKVWVSPGAR